MQAGIKSVTVVVMDVPCCQGLPVIVRKGMTLAGKEIPLDVVVISARGERKGGTSPDFQRVLDVSAGGIP